MAGCNSKLVFYHNVIVPKGLSPRKAAEIFVSRAEVARFIEFRGRHVGGRRGRVGMPPRPCVLGVRDRGN